MKTQRLVSILRLVLGLVFIVSSVTKLSAQSQFANEVISYGLLPHTLAWLYGAALPWVELFTGVALILGIFTVLALVLCILMALSFAIANTYALAQGLTDKCGSCFGQLIPLNLTVALAIDLAMILVAVLALFYRRKAADINISDFFLTRLNSKIPQLSTQSAQKMSRVILLVVIVLAVGLPLSLSKVTSTIYSDIDISLERGKPTLLVFQLEGCGECEQQKPIIEELKNLYQDSISFMYIDYKSESGVAYDFQVTSVPTILLISSKESNGYTVILRFTHLTSREQIQRSLYDKLDENIISYRYGPIADFSANPTSGRVPVNVQFVDSSLGKVENWSWDFNNDGVVDSSLQNPSHIYDEPGTYTVSLTVQGPGGSSIRTLQEYLRFDSKGCLADFQADSVLVDGIAPVKFCDLSESEGNILAWGWDFNTDGTIDSTEQNPVYTYTANGVYSVTLTVRTNDCEDTLTKRDYIRVTGCDG